jgi:uncharacterized protein YcaQ
MAWRDRREVIRLRRRDMMSATRSTMIALTLDHLRRYAVARALFAPTTLQRAIAQLGFLQADPIRAPARAQDLTLRQRVKGYRAGDLERRYAELGIDEGYFVNYGFLLRDHYLLMQPRKPRRRWSRQSTARAEQLLAFVREREVVHPREVDERFAHGTVRNYWGGSSAATTQLLEAMHYRGWLRVARRDQGVRVYAVEEPRAAADAATRRARLDALIDLVVHTYAPLPAASLSNLVARLRLAAPQWKSELPAALRRAKQRLAHERLADLSWYWPADESPTSTRDVAARVCLLAPFDPIVWDRRRFELLWGWAYRFEAYTPAAKRKLGYYALPLLWRDQVIGWANTRLAAGKLECQLGFVASRPNEQAFERALECELAAMQTFLQPRS